MIENYTQARPYAKAIFAVALKYNEFAAWSKFLEVGKKIIETFKRAHVLLTIGLTRKQRLEIVRNISEEFIFEHQENLIRLLLKRRKMQLLPQICDLYEELYKEYEKKLEIKVQTAMPLTSVQQEKLALVLQNKLERNITLAITTNPDLIGGAIVYVGDQVIDGSVLGMLKKF